MHALMCIAIGELPACIMQQDAVVVLPEHEPLVKKLAFTGQIRSVAGGLISTRDLQHWGRVCV